MSTTNTAATAMYQLFHFDSLLFGKLFMFLLSAFVASFSCIGVALLYINIPIPHYCGDADKTS